MSAEMNAKFRFDEDPCGGACLRARAPPLLYRCTRGSPRRGAAAKDDGEDDLLSLMDQSDKL